MTLELLEPKSLTEDESRQIQEAARQLAPHLTTRRGFKIQIVDEDHQETLAIPPDVLRLLSEVLSEMAQGNAVALVPIYAELTTQQAADLLNVSHLFLTGLLEEGAIPSHEVRSQTRVLLRDLFEYKRRSDAIRDEALGDLVAEAQELDLGY